MERPLERAATACRMLAHGANGKALWPWGSAGGALVNNESAHV
jgi:hypothetical protein